ncbi:Indole glucosinolate O-methyltransferase 4 [Nymphaea thermarum]|nr:Indole glucosinolate O-methyltransferase 4 [Nymphaea thermarum]
MEQKMNLQEGTTMDDQITAEAYLETISRSYVRSYSLKAAIDLGIPDIIHSHGEPLTASQLVAKIPINSPADASCLDRLMRLLVHAGVFAEEPKQTGAEEGEEVLHYGLTPVSRLLLRDGRHNLSSLAMLNLHPLVVSAWDNLAAWLRSGEFHPTAFQAKHGEPLWVKASLDHTINKLFGEAMSSVAKLFMGCMLERCGEVFEGVSSLVDVGGGNGTVAALIAEAFPHIKCMAILHDWDDKDCVKILRQCKEAIPEPGGKVIVVDVIKKKWPHQVFNELQLLVDLQMMVMNNGRERTEEEWKKLFIDAGFSSYKIVTSVGVHSLIEVRP